MIASIWRQCFYVSETENIHLRKTMTKLQLKISRRDRRAGPKLSRKQHEEHKAEVETVFPSQQQPKTLEKTPQIDPRRRFKHVTNRREAFFHHLQDEAMMADDHGGPRCLRRHMVASPQSSWMMPNVNVSGDSVAVMQPKPSVSTHQTLEHSNIPTLTSEEKCFFLSDVWRQMCQSARRPGERDNERRNKRQDTADWITWH